MICGALMGIAGFLNASRSLNINGVPRQLRNVDINDLLGREPVLLDVYENGAYDIQQELRGQYGDKLNLSVEILSVCDALHNGDRDSMLQKLRLLVPTYHTEEEQPPSENKADLAAAGV